MRLGLVGAEEERAQAFGGREARRVGAGCAAGARKSTASSATVRRAAVIPCCVGSAGPADVPQTGDASARSSAAPAASTSASAPGRPTSWSDAGRPCSAGPHGSASAGQPSALNGIRERIAALADVELVDVGGRRHERQRRDERARSTSVAGLLGALAVALPLGRRRPSPRRRSRGGSARPSCGRSRRRGRRARRRARDGRRRPRA